MDKHISIYADRKRGSLLISKRRLLAQHIYYLQKRRACYYNKINEVHNLLEQLKEEFTQREVRAAFLRSTNYNNQSKYVCLEKDYKTRKKLIFCTHDIETLPIRVNEDLGIKYTKLDDKGRKYWRIIGLIDTYISSLAYTIITGKLDKSAVYDTNKDHIFCLKVADNLPLYFMKDKYYGFTEQVVLDAVVPEDYKIDFN